MASKKGTCLFKTIARSSPVIRTPAAAATFVRADIAQLRPAPDPLKNGVPVHISPRPEFSEIFDRPVFPSEIDLAIDKIRLKPQTYENARSFAAGWDIYGQLEQDWRRMLKERQSVPKQPDGSFVRFVKWYVKKAG